MALLSLEGCRLAAAAVCLVGAPPKTGLISHLGQHRSFIELQRLFLFQKSFRNTLPILENFSDAKMP